ncbi:MAG: YesL family protein [Clostridium sp.]|uniref:YesL family protein n=1 Tax=Clostridium sp. TaxID=1506 RepID=UPI003D6CDDC2
MSKTKREFGEGTIQNISNYIFWFFSGNFYFCLLNIPLLFILLVVISNGGVPIPPWFAFIIILCCIPIGPAATALLSVMGKLIREKDISITKDFFKAYKANFFQSLFFWTIELLIIGILFINTKFFISKGYPQIVTSLIFIIIAFIFLISLYVFPIISRFYLGWKDILKTAAYYSIKKIHITLLNFASFLVIGFVLYKVSNFILLFMASAICYLLMFYQQKILLEIEDKLKKNTENIQG